MSKPPSSPTTAVLALACSCCMPGRCPVRRSRPAERLSSRERLTGCAIERAYVDKGYRDHDAQNARRVFISVKSAASSVSSRAAAPPLRHRTCHRAPEGGWSPGRCYLKGRADDAANVTLSAVGHNFRRILAWVRALCCLCLAALMLPPATAHRLNRFLNGRLSELGFIMQHDVPPKLSLTRG